MAPEDTRVDTSSATRTDDPSTAGGQLVHLPVDRSASGREDPARRGDVDEWGRSEHMRELARTLYDPIYRSWFRAEWEGLEKIPAARRRPARGQPRRRRPLRRPGDHARHRDRAGAARLRPGRPPLQALPVVGTLWSRVGGVVAHPDNAYRLLRDKQAAGAGVPRGHQGHRQARVASATGCAASAGAASSRSPCGPGVPIIPIAVVGAEEAMPIIAKINPLAKALGPPLRARSRPDAGPRPARPGRPASRPSSGCGCSTRSTSTSPPDQERYSKSRVMDAADDIRQRIQDALYDMLRARALGLDGLTMGRRVLVTGLGTFWGGRVAQQLEADPDVEVIVGLDTEPPEVELERTEFVRVDQNYSILSRIVAATKVDTIIHTFLVMNSGQMSSPGDEGDQRHRDDEPVRRRVRRRAARCERVVVKSSSLVYGADREDPALFREEMTPHPPAQHRRRAQPPRGRGLRPGLRRGQPPRHRVAAALLQRARARPSSTPFAKLLQLPVVPSIFGFDPRFQFVHEDDVVRSILFVLEHDLAGHLQRGRRRAAAVERGGHDLRQAHRARSPRWSPAAAALAAAGRSARPAARAARPAALRPRRRRHQAGASRVPTTATRRPARSRTSPGPCACARPSATADPSTATRPTSSSSSATPPPCVRDQPDPHERAASSSTSSTAWPPSPSTSPTRNALSLTMVDEIIEAFDALEADDDVGAIVVTGAPPAFCAGADLSHLGASRRGRPAPHLRGLPPRRPVAAAHHRRGQRRRRRRRA